MKELSPKEAIVRSTDDVKYHKTQALLMTTFPVMGGYFIANSVVILESAGTTTFGKVASLAMAGIAASVVREGCEMIKGELRDYRESKRNSEAVVFGSSQHNK